MEDHQSIPPLSLEELRVLGSLIEKSRTTPDNYPMTLAALTTACNQKTSRNPIVSYDEETVTLTLNALKVKGLTGTATGGSSRAMKFKHNLAIVYPLVPAELSILCLLLLRGPLTPGEINTNSARLYNFDTIEEIQQLLQKLASSTPAFVKQLSKSPGQKEARYIHLMGNANEEIVEELPLPSSSGLEERVAKLEKEIEEMKEMLNLLLN
jgi:uncharacterized protein YceH (UPF0502 family)